MKSDAYAECYDTIVAIWKDEGGETLDEIALMATITSVLANRFPFYFWTGFYVVDPAKADELVVGPYQGALGCMRIAFGRGVCGTAAATGQTQLVEDVDVFPGHIACDSRSKSEVVVPVFDKAGRLIAVFDVDSDQPAAFDETDARWLEAIMGDTFAR